MNLVDGLKYLKDSGLEFRHCIEVFGESDSNPFIKAARQAHYVEGEIEMDDVAVVSKNDDADGAYVMAWLWVSNDPAAPATSEDVYLTSDQPFTCAACGSRTHQEGEVDKEGRWTEVCTACGKRHLVENGEETDTQQFRNFYTCPSCGHEWHDEWSATCDDDCPKCGQRHISPVRSEELP